MSVCYDLRFPELYRRLAEQGADILSVPAAFTAYTGRAHWEVLLRARAVENQAYVFAPAQAGRIGPPQENRQAYGHAMIVDPWGVVLACAPEGETVVLAELDFDHERGIRHDLPALKHRRPANLFAALPDATFCLDVGHARQIDPTMVTAILMLNQFGNRAIYPPITALREAVVP